MSWLNLVLCRFVPVCLAVIRHRFTLKYNSFRRGFRINTDRFRKWAPKAQASRGFGGQALSGKFFYFRKTAVRKVMNSKHSWKCSPSGDLTIHCVFMKTEGGLGKFMQTPVGRHKELTLADHHSFQDLSANTYKIYWLRIVAWFEAKHVLWRKLRKD